MGMISAEPIGLTELLVHDPDFQFLEAFASNQARVSVFGIFANNSYAIFSNLSVKTAKKCTESPKL